MHKKLLIISVLFCSLTANSENININHVEANYNIFYKNTSAGTMTLTINNANNQIIIRTAYDGNFLATLAGKGSRDEISYISNANNVLKPNKYTYKDNKESYEIIFNDNHIEISNPKIIYEGVIYDPLYVLLTLMRNYPKVNNSYKVISKKNLKVYKYKYEDKKSIVINEKKYSGYSAEYATGNKINYFFFSREHKNLMVYSSIKKNGKEKIRIELSKIKILNGN